MTVCSERCANNRCDKNFIHYKPTFPITPLSVANFSKECGIYKKADWNMTATRDI